MIGPRGGQVARLEQELDVLKEFTVKTPVNPGEFGDLVESPVGTEHLADIAKEIELQVSWERGNGQSRDDVIDRLDSTVGQDRRQLASASTTSN